MHLIVFIGIQATGKSSFYRARFFHTHVRLNLDMLKTRHREGILFDACLNGKAAAVVDNTNLTNADRARYIGPAKQAGFRVSGYFFESKLADALARNSTRTGKARIPDPGIRSASHRLELPSIEEGFDELFFVRLNPPDEFTLEEWKHEV